jgi:hypothetical protein
LNRQIRQERHIQIIFARNLAALAALAVKSLDFFEAS